MNRNPTPTHQGQPVLRIDEPFLAEPTYEETSRHRAYRFTLAATRLALGFTFLWAFLDKTFGLGFATPAAKAWVNGGSPTKGFLGNVEGPFAGFYQSFAGAGWANWLFMIGLLGIGLALMLGVAMRIAAVAGVTLLVLMWTAVLPITTNPFLDYHLTDALVLVVLALTAAGKTLGFGRAWEKIPFVHNHGILK